MIRRTLLMVVLTVLLCSNAALAVWGIDIHMSHMKHSVFAFSGHTDYTIEALTYDVSEDLSDTSLVGIRSKLEFPLDVMLAGTEIGLHGKSAMAKKGWELNASLSSNVTDPNGMMEDHDWFFDPSSRESQKWSWTESRAKINYLLLRVEMAIAVIKSDRLSLAYLIGYQYSRIEWDMIGFDGWQIDESNRISGLERSLYYKAIYRLPLVGSRLKITPSLQSSMELQLAGGRLMASDLDDHLLRGKTAEAETAGWAFLGQAAVRLMLARSGSARPFLSARMEFVTQSASGTQTQEWYRDEVYLDPVTNEEVILARKGTVVSGINYETTARQVRVGVGLGLAF